MIWPWQAEEIGRRLAAASDGTSATIEETTAAGQDIAEENGRRLAAMLAEKGILLNSRNRSK